MMFPRTAREYLIGSLANTPLTMAALLSRLPSNDMVWDARPDVDRFNLREIAAHLADWDEVWRERLERVLNEETPMLLRPDVNRRAEEQGYATADPQRCTARFLERRNRLASWLSEIPEESWQRRGHLERLGNISMEGYVTLIFAHDSYHLRQIGEWLSEESEVSR